MEAKGTVMTKRLTKIFDHYAVAFEVDGRYSPAPWVQEVTNLIKEIVEQVEECRANTDCFQEDGSVAYKAGDIVITTAHWQAFLKERGLEVIE